MLDISEIVSKALENATRDEIENIVKNGVKLPDSDMLEALENEFYAQAKDMLNNYQIARKAPSFRWGI
jgi:hypothetical protein